MFTETVECVDGGLARLLEAVRAGDLPVAQLKDLIATSRAWEAKVAALQVDAARLISNQKGHGDGGASVLRDQAGKSKSQARRSLGAAEALDEMPSLRSSVDSGEVPLANAERLADAARRTDPEAVDSASDWPWPRNCRRTGSPAKPTSGPSATRVTTATVTGSTSVGGGI